MKMARKVLKQRIKLTQLNISITKQLFGINQIQISMNKLD